VCSSIGECTADLFQLFALCSLLFRFPLLSVSPASLPIWAVTASAPAELQNPSSQLSTSPTSDLSIFVDAVPEVGLGILIVHNRTGIKIGKMRVLDFQLLSQRSTKYSFQKLLSCMWQ
jgi:hypothetical protein